MAVFGWREPLVAEIKEKDKIAALKKWLKGWIEKIEEREATHPAAPSQEKIAALQNWLKAREEREASARRPPTATEYSSGSV
jgi:hypothetical protein